MNVGTPVKNTVRNVYMLEFRPGFYPQELVMSIRANGFLKQMVRNIAGLIKCIGKKELPLQKVKDIIHKKDRTLAPATAPAQGLCLEQVEY
jgi:tRNA pseudouridine38-40 synthase